MHHDLIVKMLNDRYGIQTRGGCSCAGTYGHYLLGIDHDESDKIIYTMTQGNLLMKPGWVRFSIHPTTSNEEIKYVCDSLIELATNCVEWAKDYEFHEGRFTHKDEAKKPYSPLSTDWFDL
jgi:selenocysteine lyase/cysteine desulfurase